MSKSKIDKFENENRIRELCPTETLRRIGVGRETVVCDLGAGSGIFSFPAAELSEAEVYALEISEEMLEVLQARRQARQKNNLIIKKVDSVMLPLENRACDIVIMVTVLHEVEHREEMLREIRRILKADGKVMIIEFQKKETSFGPPLEQRIAQEQLEQVCTSNGFKIKEKWIMGENFYALVFLKE